MRHRTEELGVIVVGKDDVFTPPFECKRERVGYSLFAGDEDSSLMFPVRQAVQSDELRLQDELAAWDAASDEAWPGLDI